MPDQAGAPDPSESRGSVPTRRDVLKGLAGLAGVAWIPALIAACGGSAGPGAPASAVTASEPSPTGSPAPAATSAAASASIGQLTLAANLPIGDIAAAFTRETGIATRIRTVIPTSFGGQIEAYLSGVPEDVVTFVGGRLMRGLANEGLLEPIDDVWARVGSRFSAALRAASTGDDGRLYAVPYAHGPWAVFYRKSVFDEHRYAVPRTWTELMALGRAMLRDGIVPFAMGDAEQFPALGMFDILDLRQNGYRFHLDLMAGTASWTDPRLHDVFERWRDLLPLTQTGSPTRTYADAAQAVLDKKAAMLYMGMFVTNSFADQGVVDDLDLFAFPSLGTAFDPEWSVEDPVDAYVLARNSPDREADLDNAKAFLEFLSRAPNEAAVAAAAGGPGTLPAVVDAASSGLSPFQARAAGIVSAAGTNVSQFLDRDTPLGFGTRVGEILQGFLLHPDRDLSDLTGRIQAAWTKG